jgi:hypothetical protein
MSKSKSSMHPATEMLPLVSAGEPDAAPTLAGHAAAIRALGKRVIGDVIEIGRRLTEAKVIAGHGNWLPWLEREFAWKERTAQRFMNVAAVFGTNPSGVTDLELPVEGLYLLAAPSTPEEARTKVIERAEKGEALSVAEIKETIEQARGKEADDLARQVQELFDDNPDRATHHTKQITEQPEPPKKVAPSMSTESGPPKVLSNEEANLVDQKLGDVCKAMQRLVECAVGCNRSAEIISNLQNHLDYLDGWAAKVARPRAGGAR